MINFLYIRLIKNKFFSKISLIYIAILIFAMFALALTLSMNISTTLKNNQVDYNSSILYNINNFFEEKYRNSMNISKVMYRDGYTASGQPGIFNFLENNYDKLSEEYLLYKSNFDKYFDQMFSRDSDIFNIIVYQKLDNRVYLFTKNSHSDMDLDSFEYVKRFEQIDHKYTSIGIYPTLKPNYSKETEVYTISIPIKALANIDTNIGVLLLDFRLDGIKSSLQQYTGNFKGHILVLTPSGDIVFDSSDRYYGKKYPYLALLNHLTRTVEIDGQKCIASTKRDNKLGLIIATIIPQNQVLSSVKSATRTIYLITLVCIIAALLLTIISTTVFSKRIKTITGFMKKVRTGNLSERIPVSESTDEIGEIAISYNKMCDNLQSYINRVYLSEIKQKSAELTALQAQINPHFLYNTLEVIRMKAEIMGENEVGDMIYILSRLFKNTIKEEQIISIENEIKNSQLYLELFKIRYRDKLCVDVNICEEIYRFGVIKHIIQPVIENYIVHGFDKDREDNLISLTASKINDVIRFTISDNGKGIDFNNFQLIKGRLENPESSFDSIGLSNVNERIKIIYGNNCGIEISSSEAKGTTVSITILAKTKEELKEHVQGINS